jgi:predicted GNAT superfamily acetyltransferase
VESPRESSSSSPVSISLVTTVDETDVALGVCRQVWGPGSVRDRDTYFVSATHGGYFAVARADQTPVGASFGLLSNAGKGLHSHMTAVVASHAGLGIGLALKQHQRQWAIDHGIDAITWTFDPLVRRNAWFNLVRLGATVSAFRANYYGALGDAINGDDESDRFEVSWSVTTSGGSVAVETAGDVLIDMPADIEQIRAKDTHSFGGGAREWRLRMRADLDERLRSGWQVVGLNANYQYVLRQP